MFEGLIVAVICLWMCSYFVQGECLTFRELGRFKLSSAESVGGGWGENLEKWFEMLGKAFGKSGSVRNESVLTLYEDMEAKMREAGLEKASDHGRFVLIRLGCYLSWPLLVIFACFNFSTYYASVTAIFGFAFVVVMPHLFLSRKIVGRKEDIQRELPLVVDLTNLATSAGWDISVALDKVVEAVALEYPRHPLIKELRKAHWLAQRGYTWSEALEWVAKRLREEESVSRVMFALIQAMEHGGDMTQALAGIAQDSERSYYAGLDKRLAAVPGKALVITMVLFLCYFAILLAPAATGLRGSFGAL
ncbi:MAG: type II secretion system F family protein [Deltaproteobacteria bacterium]|nr:type II secretion system F family protein [Deltaproteobacteria bacterium]